MFFLFMSIKETIELRHSIRNFSNKIPSVGIILEIIRYANLAPSAGNLQARDFIIIEDPKIKNQLSEAAFNQDFIKDAPINIVVCANLNRISSYGKRGVELYCLQDVAASVENILLLAVDFGLGACWVGAFDEKSVMDILNLPSYIRPVSIIPIGYVKGKIESTDRMDTRSLIHYDKW